MGDRAAPRELEPGVQLIGDELLRVSYADHGQPLDWPAVFGREAPLELEVGTSGGEFLARRAAAQPDVDHVGIEVKNRRAQSCAARIRRLELTNARVVHGDAGQLIGCLFWPATLSRIYVLFPDPWPKQRHHKHRFVNRWTAQIAGRLLRPGGELVLATDDADYLTWMREVAAAEPTLEGPVYDEPASPYGFPTRYETYWIAEGRTIRYLVYRRIMSP